MGKINFYCGIWIISIVTFAVKIKIYIYIWLIFAVKLDIVFQFLLLQYKLDVKFCMVLQCILMQ